MTLNTFADNTQFSAVAWNAMTNAHNYEAVLSGLTPSDGASGLDVDYASGTALANGTFVSPTSGTVTLSAADPSNPRVDIITVDDTATVSDTTGTAAADPVAPDIPSGETLIAAVEVAAGATTLATADIHDYRVLLADPSSELADGGAFEMDADEFAAANGASDSLLQSDGTAAAWATLASIDAADLGGQAGSDGQFLETDGTAASWSTLPTATESGSFSVTSNGSNSSAITFSNTYVDVIVSVGHKNAASGDVDPSNDEARLDGLNTTGGDYTGADINYTKSGGSAEITITWWAMGITA